MGHSLEAELRRSLEPVPHVFIPLTLIQLTLVLLQRQHVAGSPVQNPLGDLPLAAHGVDGDDAPLQFQHWQQLGDGGDVDFQVAPAHGTVRFLPLFQGPLAGVVEGQGREQADEHQNVQYCPGFQGVEQVGEKRICDEEGRHYDGDADEVWPGGFLQFSHECL